MKLVLVMMLLCTSCMAQTQSGQPHNAHAQGPIRLEGDTSKHGPLYTLNVVNLADTKPTSHTWLLQEQVYTDGNGIAELHSTAFNALNSPTLRKFLTHLPKDAELVYSRIQSAGDPTPEVQGPSGSEKGLPDFISFCRDNKIRLTFGMRFN